MKSILVLAVLLGSIPTWANEPGRPDEGANFEKRKQSAIQEIEQHISVLQSFKACISSATQHDNMKHCHEEKESKMKEFQTQREAKHREELDQRIQKLQQERDRLNQHDRK